MMWFILRLGVLGQRLVSGWGFLMADLTPDRLLLPYIDNLGQVVIISPKCFMRSFGLWYINVFCYKLGLVFM